MRRPRGKGAASGAVVRNRRRDVLPETRMLRRKSPAAEDRTEPVCKSTRKPQGGWEMRLGSSCGQASGCLAGCGREYGFYSRDQRKLLKGLCQGMTALALTVICKRQGWQQGDQSGNCYSSPGWRGDRLGPRAADKERSGRFRTHFVGCDQRPVHCIC